MNNNFEQYNIISNDILLNSIIQQFIQLFVYNTFDNFILMSSDSVKYIFGFDPSIYLISNNPIPTKQQFIQLWNHYKNVYFNNKILFIQHLKTNLVNGKYLHIGKNFQWKRGLLEINII